MSETAIQDIVERLRNATGGDHVPVYNEDGEYDGVSLRLKDNVALCHEAADEISLLRNIVRALHARTGLDDRPYPWADGDHTSQAFRRAFRMCSDPNCPRWEFPHSPHGSGSREGS